jgi:hypothetical protein
MTAEQDAAPDVEEYRARSGRALRIHIPFRHAGELPVGRYMIFVVGRKNGF